MIARREFLVALGELPGAPSGYLGSGNLVSWDTQDGLVKLTAKNP
jgi:hypothetical protein